MRPAFLLALAALLMPVRLMAGDLPAVRMATHGYAEYVAGDLPIVLAAPHGGRLSPESIPDRRNGVHDSDENTQELARTIAEVIHERTGQRLHLIICHLHRKKLDANREIEEAAAGQPEAEQAWREYHGFIEEARAHAVARAGVAFVIDLHGHSHPGGRVELGYRHTVDELAAEDAVFNTPQAKSTGTLQLIAERDERPYADLLRGSRSLGALLEEGGFRATPSPSAPHPVAPYFRGGYTVARHCRAEEMSTGLQIECFRVGLRDTAEKRLAFARTLAVALERFLAAELGVTLGRSTKPVAGEASPGAESAAQ